MHPLLERQKPSVLPTNLYDTMQCIYHLDIAYPGQTELMLPLRGLMWYFVKEVIQDSFIPGEQLWTCHDGDPRHPSRQVEQRVSVDFVVRHMHAQEAVQAAMKACQSGTRENPIVL